MRSDGFTLVEMLVALFIFAVLSAATLQAMTTTFQTRDAVDQSIARTYDIQALDRLFRQDMENIVTRPTRDNFGALELESLQSYTADGALLKFTRGGRSNPQGLAPRGDVMRIAYRIDGETLIRETASLPTPALNTPIRRRVLLDGVRRADITAYQNGRPALQLVVPSGSTALPTLITLEIETDRGILTLTSGVG